MSEFIGFYVFKNVLNEHQTNPCQLRKSIVEAEKLMNRPPHLKQTYAQNACVSSINIKMAQLDRGKRKVIFRVVSMILV